MIKKIMSIFAAVLLLQQLGCAPDTDRYRLRINFLPGEYALRVLEKVRIERDGAMSLEDSREISWNIVSNHSEHPGTVSLELKKVNASGQVQFPDRLVEFSYDSEQPSENMPRMLSALVGPKVETKLTASFLNNNQEIGNVGIIEQGDPNVPFGKKAFDNHLGIINNIHALLPQRRAMLSTKKVKVGDSWQRSLIRLLISNGEISQRSQAVVAVVTFENIVKCDTDDTKLAVLKVVIDAEKNRLSLGGILPTTLEDVVVTSEGRIVLNILNGIPVSYTAKTKMSYVRLGSKYEIHEEFKYEFIFTSDVSDLP